MRRQVITRDETPLKSVYCGIEITYDEEANCWRFTKNGRDRSADTLQNAKKAILYKDPADKPAFTAVNAYCKPEYRNEYRLVKVTSVAERSYGEPEYWISYGNGVRNERQKIEGHKLFEASKANEATIAKMKAIEEQIEGLHKLSDRVERSMKRLVIAKPKRKAKSDGQDS